MEAIVLAGGFGTRLKSVINDVPKPLAPINNRAFLEYLFDYLIQNGIKKAILSIGYKAELISGYFGDSYKNLKIEYVYEKTPLGTGGAIKKSLKNIQSDYVFIFNGDSFFDVDLNRFKEFFQKQNSDISIALKRMKNFDRYGLVELNGDNITAFQEKRFCEDGYINGGIYLLKRDILKNINLDSFSFESDFLQKELNNIDISGFKSDGYFIDIGIPEDYKKAQEYFR
jgi:D-glycero-alpha-D-manno-heptose 1-phosphate guanylyltransferase